MDAAPLSEEDLRAFRDMAADVLWSEPLGYLDCLLAELRSHRGDRDAAVREAVKDAWKRAVRLFGDAAPISPTVEDVSAAIWNHLKEIGA